MLDRLLARKTGFRVALALLFLTSLAARLPLCWEPAAVRNDGAEYLAIARHLRTEGRYATDLKYQFWSGEPVRHEAWADRPPLYPAFAALCQLALPGVDPTAAARLGNAVLAALAAVLAALYLRRLYDARTGLLAAAFVFMLPHTLYWTSQPMTESLSLALSLGALLAWAQPGSGRAALGAGILSGLLYLARPAGALLPLAFLLDGLLRPGRERRALALLLLLAGFAACAAPYHLLLWSRYGSPFHSALGYALAVGTYYEVTYYGFEAPRATAAGFLRARWHEIPARMATQLGNHLQALLMPLAGFLPLAAGMRRGAWSGPRRPGALLVLLTLLLHTAVWSAWGSTRYFLLPILLLAGALLGARAGGGEKRETHPASAILDLLPVLSFAGLAVALAFFYRTELGPLHGVPSLPEIRRAAAATRDARLIASDRPSTLNLLTERPAVMLPRTTDPAKLRRFVETYHPDVMALFVEEPEKASARAMAAAWRSGALPAGWNLEVDTDRLLIARSAAPAPGRGP